MRINPYLIILLLFSCALLAQTTNKATDESSDSEKTTDEIAKPESSFEQIKLERLKRIRSELVELQSKIYGIRKRLKEDDLDMVSKIQADSKLAALEQEYMQKRFSFIETITEINLKEEKKKAQKADFLADIQQILQPAMNSFKQLSERPRQIQDLQEDALYVNTRLEDAKTALKKINNYIKNNPDKSLSKKLKDSKKTIEKMIKELEIDKEDLTFKIRKIEKDQEPFISTFSKLILDFFKTKGLNLFLAFTVFIGVFWGFRLSQPRIISIILFRINRSDKKEMYQWIARPIRVLYNVFSIVLAFFLGIITLYALNDWVLVTFILFTLAALIWSSKQYLPAFLEQSKIVLNLGAIREGERVLFNGIPWQIKSLGYYCHLYNPVLSGGFMRVSTKELLNLTSRRIIDKEPWFPTKTGDWVEVNSLFGQVILQSPENVIIKQLGDEKTIIASNDFYSKSPTNLSNGYSIEFQFGVDYMHQKILFDELIPNFIKEISEAINKKHAEFSENFGELTIEFLQAGASSLDLRFFLRCDGSIAGKKKLLMRSIQAEFVKVCNRHHYVIPFNQLTVHMAATDGKA
ncbi:MAG: hypothetical protein CME62_03880 [Halobacteriovoraceae bacterium]|nr:hypothetical protein [Halobacteriovoraceae bacterium]|tara:strand:+ start:2311 stop:4041 length:1731 start_codon:yes stop_codon:yes gene_type:complete